MRGSGRKREGGTGRAALTLLAASLLVSAGAGIGLPSLAKAGWSAPTAIGLLALGAGIVLGAVGLVWAVRRARGWWRLPVALVSAAGVLLVVNVLAIPLAATVVPPTPGDGRTPADIGLAFREVRLPTSGGAELAAWYVPTRNGAAVVLLHGSGSTRSSTLAHAAVLARHGYGVLLLDARGHGQSTGRAMDFGWNGDADLGSATAYLASPEAGVDTGRIGAVGLSMGGEEALGALAGDLRLRAVVAEGATGRVAADLDWLSDRYGWRGRVQEVLEVAHTRVAAVLSGLDPPGPLREALAVSRAPVLLVTASERRDEGYAAVHLRAAAPGRVQVWSVAGAEHAAGLAAQPGEWEQRVVGFLDQALLGSRR